VDSIWDMAAGSEFGCGDVASVGLPVNAVLRQVVEVPLQPDRCTGYAVAGKAGGRTRHLGSRKSGW
jgi:hypothetical protein